MQDRTHKYHGGVHVTDVFLQELIVELLRRGPVDRPKALAWVGYFAIGDSGSLEDVQDF